MPAKKKPVAARHSKSSVKDAMRINAPNVHRAPAKAQNKKTRLAEKSICNGQQSKDQGAHNKAQLQCRGEAADCRCRPAHLLLQVGHDRIDGKPQGSSRKLCQNKNGKNTFWRSEHFFE